MYSEWLFGHLSWPGQDHILIQALGPTSTLLPEYRHRTTCLHKTVNKITNREDLLSLTEISYVTLIVYSSDIETSARPQVLPPWDDQVFNFEIPKWLDDEPYVALDNWCVPSNVHVVFLEAL